LPFDPAIEALPGQKQQQMESRNGTEI